MILFSHNSSPVQFAPSSAKAQSTPPSPQPTSKTLSPEIFFFHLLNKGHHILPCIFQLLLEHNLGFTMVSERQTLYQKLEIKNQKTISHQQPRDQYCCNKILLRAFDPSRKDFFHRKLFLFSRVKKFFQSQACGTQPTR